MKRCLIMLVIAALVLASTLAYGTGVVPVMNMGSATYTPTPCR